MPHVSTDSSVKLDYDIIYIRALRAGDEVHKQFFTEIATPVYMVPGADLMLLDGQGNVARVERMFMVKPTMAGR